MDLSFIQFQKCPSRNSVISLLGGNSGFILKD